jgi:predicted adenylyl cyclase CyaB
MGAIDLCVHKTLVVSYPLPMARNIEIKARIDSVDALLPRARAIADDGPTEIVQDDTFFSCPNGRLKLRAFTETAGELIFYQRADSAGPKESFYVISQTASPNSLREILSLAYGASGRVRKHRTLFMVGRTRVHLDRVEGLGDFLELEVVLSEDETTEAGVKVAHELLGTLGISREQLVEGAYVDLLQQGDQSTAPRDAR